MRRLRTLECILLVLVALLMLPGCWVMTVHPLSQDDDVSVADPGLGGQWWQQEHDCRLTITALPSSARHQFTLEYSVPEKGAKDECAQRDGAPTLELGGRLVDLQGHLFLDVLPSETSDDFQTIPTHSIFRVTVGKDGLDLVPLNPEFVAKAIREGKIEGLDVETGGKLDELVITSRTSELRKFVLSAVDDAQAFPVIDEDRTWHFARMPAGVPPRAPSPKPACQQ